MKNIKIGENVYEVLEYGNLLGNISHVRLSNKKFAEVIYSEIEGGELYCIIRYSDGTIDAYWEKDLENYGMLPLMLLDEDCVEEGVFTGKVVSVRRCDDHDLVEFMVPPGMGEYLFIVGEFDFLDEE